MAYPSLIHLTPKIVQKGWGSETHLCNNEEFCGKILRFNKGSRFSMHMHLAKREVFFVQSGTIELTTINTEDASRETVKLSSNDTVEISRMLPHQILAIEDSVVLEFSTFHEDSDSFRVEPGDNQKK